MVLNDTIEKINEGRDIYETGFVMCLWKDPMLYQEYEHLNEGNDKTLIDEEAYIYYIWGKAMYRLGYRSFDATTCEIFFSDKPGFKKKYDSMGGYDGIVACQSAVDTQNVDGYYDEIVKRNALMITAQKYEELFSNPDQFKKCTSEDVYNVFENLNNSIAIKTSSAENIDEVGLNKEFYNKLESGMNQGYSYGKYAPLLNYITSGCAPSSLFMLSGHSGTGKSSFTFGVMIMGLVAAGANVAVISNEMQIDTYKILLLEHIFTHDMGYWGLTRKQIILGKFNDEQKQMMEKAMQIQQEKYSGIKFVKLYDNNMNKITKYLRKLKSNYNTQVILLDTFKVDDDVDTGVLWQSLMLDTRKIFREADKLKMCVVTTYQLALHTLNQRYLDATCLSNAKSIKEVYETMIFCRVLWDDEYTGEKHDVQCYKLKKDNPKIKEMITLDKDKKYVVFFVDKNRADDNAQTILYEFNPRFNYWNEVGFCKITNEHKNF